MPIVTCLYCNKKLNRSPSRVSKRNFCCFDHWISYQKRNSKITSCAQCGKEIYRRAVHILRSKRHFCSPKCHNTWEATHPRTGKKSPRWDHVALTCDQCGKPISRKRSQAEKYDYHFCSHRCHYEWQKTFFQGENNPAWNGGYEPYYGPNWNLQRNKARKRDGYACLRCGATEVELGNELSVHHYVSFAQFSPDQYKEANCLNNLGSFCRSCHLTIEGKGKDWQ